MAINDSPGDDKVWRIETLRHALESSSHADAVLLVPAGGPLPDDWHAAWQRAGWSITAPDDCVDIPKLQSGPDALSLIVSAWPRVGDSMTTSAAKTAEGSRAHDSRAEPGIGGSTAPFPTATGGNGRTLRRGDFLAHLTAVMAMPENESWVLLAIRVDQLPELASLGLSAMFELEEQVFARLLALLHGQDVSTIWMEFGFGILVRRDDWSQVETFARQLCKHVAEEPFQMTEVDIGLTVSIGMALVPPASTPEGGHRWFAIAHAAQAIAYRHGGNQCEGVLSRAYEPMPAERVLIIREWLQEAKTGSNVVVEFQPVLPLGADTAPMYTICVKLRDHRAPLGGVYRAEFHPLATGTGALTMIDRLSLFSAVEALEQERAHGRATELVVPIDLSTLDGVPWRWLEAELVRHGAISSGLVLELQASTAMQEPEVVERFVRLRSLGVRISVHDPYGGLASTQTWSALPVDMLRLPTSALDGVSPSECFAEISRWREQGRRLILDGVEGAGAISRLSEYHVDYLSGDALAPIGPKLDFDFA